MVNNVPFQAVVSPVSSRSGSPPPTNTSDRMSTNSFSSLHGEQWMAMLQSGEPVSFSSNNATEEVKNLPLLTRDNAQRLPHGSVVRILGFVQDMFDTEYFQADDDNDRMTERTPILVTPIPYSTVSSRHSGELLTAVETQQESLDYTCRQSKRLRTSANDMNCDDETECGWRADEMQSDPRMMPVLCLFYYEQYNNSPDRRVHLNQVVEIVGVLDRSGEEESAVQHNDSHQDTRMDDGWEDDNTNAYSGQTLIPSLVPRLHVLSFEENHCCDSLEPTVAVPPQTPSPPACLAQALRVSDSPAMSLLYLTLLSKAERDEPKPSGAGFATPSKTPFGTTLGCASLNLVLPDAATSQTLQRRLEQLLGHVVPVLNSQTVTPATLERELSLPSKTHGGRIRPTPLQLPRGAVLILNVSELQAGRLSPAQTEALQGLQGLALSHVLHYKFEGNMQLPYEADWRILVLSTPQTRKLLPCTLEASCDVGVTRNQPQPEQHDNKTLCKILRNALHKARECPRIYFAPEFEQHVPEAFCRLRKTSQKTTEAHLHQILVLARLCARSQGALKATVEHWDQAVSLLPHLL